MFDKTTPFNPRAQDPLYQLSAWIDLAEQTFHFSYKTQPAIYIRSRNQGGWVVSPRQVELAFKCNESRIHISNTMELLGVTIDDKLNFENHIAKICRKVSRQIAVLIKGSMCQLMNE